MGGEPDRVVTQKPAEESTSKRERREPREAVYVPGSTSVILHSPGCSLTKNTPLQDVSLFL